MHKSYYYDKNIKYKSRGTQKTLAENVSKKEINMLDLLLFMRFTLWL